MVRAGAVKHPVEWAESGCLEIQAAPERYAIVDLRGLTKLCGFEDVEDFQKAHRQWIEEALASELGLRDARWSEATCRWQLGFRRKGQKRAWRVKAMAREAVETGNLRSARATLRKLTLANWSANRGAEEICNPSADQED
jgi:putative transposase